MKEIIVKTQKDLQKIKTDFEGTIYIEGGTYDDPIVYEANFKEATVISRGTAYMVLRNDAALYQMRGSSTVAEMRESSTVAEMRESSTVRQMRESSTVRLYGESMVSAYSAKLIECHGYNVIRIMDGQ